MTVTTVTVKKRGAWQRFTHWVIDVAVDLVLWGGVLMAASGLGQLLEAVVDTVRHGQPR